MRPEEPRVGVAGVGALGYHHARILASLPGVSMAGVHDIRAERAREVSSDLGVTAHEELGPLLDACDALVVAVPTSAHESVARAALERGLAYVSPYNDLDDVTREKLDGLEAVCSLAHHDKKINKYSPDYPILTPEQRAANPPNRVPLVLRHPVSGEKALYGLNSSTCAILPKGEEISPEILDICDLEGDEHESVQIFARLHESE